MTEGGAIVKSYRKALVTGGAGFIGHHLARALIREGLEVVVLDNLSTGRKENVPAGASFIEGDILNDEDVRKALSGVDILFHEAARVSIRSSVERFAEDAETNITGTLNLLRHCAGSGVKKLVYASSMAVYADSPSQAPLPEGYAVEPISPYGIGKLAGEKYCLNICGQLGIRAVVLRYFNTYGIGQAFTPYVGVITIFIKRLLAGESPTVFGSGMQVRDFVHVGDIVSGNIRAMNWDGESGIFNIGTGVGTSVLQIARLLTDKINPSLPILFGEEQPGEIHNSVADISRGRSILGCRPEGRLESRIDEVIAWHRDKSREGA